MNNAIADHHYIDESNTVLAALEYQSMSMDSLAEMADVIIAARTHSKTENTSFHLDIMAESISREAMGICMDAFNSVLWGPALKTIYAQANHHEA